MGLLIGKLGPFVHRALLVLLFDECQIPVLDLVLRPTADLFCNEGPLLTI